MKVVICFLLITLLVGTGKKEPRKLKWSQLTIEKYEEVWNEEGQGYYNDAIFTNEQKKLNGELVFITGFLNHFEMDSLSSYYILSETKINMMHMHYVNPDQVIEIGNFSLSWKDYKKHYSDSVQVKIGGKLIVNLLNDVEHLYYMLDSAYVASD